jgi:hypothetical protein
MRERLVDDRLVGATSVLSCIVELICLEYLE